MMLVLVMIFGGKAYASNDIEEYSPGKYTMYLPEKSMEHIVKTQKTTKSFCLNQTLERGIEGFSLVLAPVVENCKIVEDKTHINFQCVSPKRQKEIISSFNNCRKKKFKKLKDSMDSVLAKVKKGKTADEAISEDADLMKMIKKSKKKIMKDALSSIKEIKPGVYSINLLDGPVDLMKKQPISDQMHTSLAMTNIQRRFKASEKFCKNKGLTPAKYSDPNKCKLDSQDFQFICFDMKDEDQKNSVEINAREYHERCK